MRLKTFSYTGSNFCYLYRNLFTHPKVRLSSADFQTNDSSKIASIDPIFAPLILFHSTFTHKGQKPLLIQQHHEKVVPKKLSLLGTTLEGEEPERVNILF